MTTDRIRKLEAELEKEREMARTKKGPVNALFGLGFIGYAMISSSIAAIGLALPPLALIAVAFAAIFVICIFFVGFKKLLFMHPAFCLMVILAIFLGVLWQHPAEVDFVQSGFWFFFSGVLSSFSLVLSNEARKEPRIYIEAILINFILGILIMNAPEHISGLIININENFLLRLIISLVLILFVSAWAWRCRRQSQMNPE